MDRGRYVDHWGPYRFASLGSIIAFPPGETLCLRTVGGRRSSLICQLRTAAVRKWLDRDFQFTDRRLEVCLDIANATIRGLLLRLARELHSPSVASTELAESITLQLSIELARHRKSRGCSIAVYMTQTRIEAAKRRLATHESIKEIAGSMGFSCQSTFTYAFRRTTGVTPNQFRTRMLRGGERFTERS